MSPYVYQRETHKTSKHLKKNVVDGVTVTAVVIGEMPGLQSVSGWLPARDTHKLTIHILMCSHTEHAPQHIQYLPVSVTMETDRPLIDKTSDTHVYVCVCM